MRNKLTNPIHQRIVIKIGSHVLSDGSTFPTERLSRLAQEIVALMRAGNEILLITSGAVLMGQSMLNLQLDYYPRALKQALSAMGQVDLISEYRNMFNDLDQTIGQILINLDDFQQRQRYLNIKETIFGLFKLGALPVLNENDPIYTEDMSFGDNDNLASQVAGMLDADLLLILSTVDGLYDGNPADAKREVIREVEIISEELILDSKSKGQLLSTGGMSAKLRAIRNTNHIGIPVLLANGAAPGILTQIFEGKAVGTLFHASPMRMPLKKRWLAYSSNSEGVITIDEGACAAIVRKKASLLSSGVIGMEGHFEAQAPVIIATADGEHVARGITNYGSRDLSAIAGKSSKMFAETLGSNYFNEVVHREQMVILPQHKRNDNGR